MSVPNSGICVSSGNPRDPEIVVREYGPLVSVLCRRMIVDREKARDAAMEVWVEVLKSLPGFRGESAISTWITVIARRTLYRWIAGEREYDFRTFKKECRVTVHPDVEDIGRNDPERMDLWTRMVCDICLTSILHCLEPESRFIFILRAVSGMDYAEIGRIMEIGEAAARQRFSRARRKLARFGKSECALLNPSGACRCGQKKFIENTVLVEEFKRLRATVNRVETWMHAEKVFPGIDYWREMIS